MTLTNIQIVLVRAENPANIGQAARAMKNFGLSNLRLADCVPHKVQEAYTLGWNAREILDNARVFGSGVGAPLCGRPQGGHAGPPLQEAVKDSVFTVGFTRRSGHSRGEPRSFPEVLPQVMEAASDHHVSLVFGNEKNGLSNEEIRICHVAAVLPTSPEYGSLNLSHAVAIVGFLLFDEMIRRGDPCPSGRRASGRLQPKKPERIYATQEELEALTADFKDVLEALDYEDTFYNDLLTRTLNNLRRLFKKAGLERREFHLFKAFLSRVGQRIVGAGPRACPQMEHDQRTGQPQGVAPT